MNTDACKVHCNLFPVFQTIHMENLTTKKNSTKCEQLFPSGNLDFQKDTQAFTGI